MEENAGSEQRGEGLGDSARIRIDVGDGNAVWMNNRVIVTVKVKSILAEQRSSSTYFLG